MSQQPKPASYMQKLDQWIEDEVFEKLYAIWQKSPDGDTASASAEAIKKTIRTKVLESYHNGQQAGPRQARRGA